MEICEASSFWLLKEKATFDVRAASLSWTPASGRARRDEFDMKLFQRQVMHVSRTLMNLNQSLVPVYLSNQPVDRRNESPVWHSLRSLYNFRPHFPQRPLNLTAIWRFAAITVHSWVKINLQDSSLGQGVWRHTWLCAAYDNLLWFIYLQMIPLI